MGAARVCCQRCLGDRDLVGALLGGADPGLDRGTICTPAATRVQRGRLAPPCAAAVHAAGGQRDLLWAQHLPDGHRCAVDTLGPHTGVGIARQPDPLGPLPHGPPGVLRPGALAEHGRWVPGSTHRQAGQGCQHGQRAAAGDPLAAARWPASGIPVMAGSLTS